MISELQIHTIARQMLERHGFAAIAKAAEQAQACEGRGEADEAKEWRHIADAMKIIGHRSNALATILGYAPRAALVHRNHMALL